MTLTDQARQLLYICGSGHSGSTLLDLLLGGHSQIAALGEAHRIYLSAHHASRLHRCVCGAELASCPFWQAVSEELQRMLGIQDPEILRKLPTTDPAFLQLDAKGDYLAPANWAWQRPRSLGSRLSLAALMCGSKPLWRLAAATVPAARRDRLSARNSLLIFEAVRRAHSKPVIVDSTKNPGRLKALYLESELPMRLIYLVRDGRAVCHSRMRRDGVTMQIAARVWVAEHRRQRLARLTIPPHLLLQVSYERLCTEPQAELSRICGFIGLDVEPGMLAFRGDRHGVGGNPMRFRTEEMTIRLDERWRTELAAEDLATFERMAGRLNTRLGYGG